MSSPTRTAFILRDQRHRLAVRSADPLIQLYHDAWLSLPKARRHALVDAWTALPDAMYYAELHSYLESLVRLTTAWLRKAAPRTPEQVAALARAHNQKAQDVRRDLDTLMVERQRAWLISQSKREAAAQVRQERATARAYAQAAVLLDDEDLDDE